LNQLSKEGYLDVFYYDESHFGLVPVVPYAWQQKDEPILLPSSRGKYINVAGFLSKDNQFISYQYDTTIRSDKLVDIFNDFASRTVKKTIVILDNAPIHRSKLFKAQINRWREQNDLFLFFLPTYSPELNLIEILWKRIKYTWLEFQAYESYQNLKKHLNQILENVGNKLNIHFG
jgi:transposase